MRVCECVCARAAAGRIGRKISCGRGWPRGAAARRSGADIPHTPWAQFHFNPQAAEPDDGQLSRLQDSASPRDQAACFAPTLSTLLPLSLSLSLSLSIPSLLRMSSIRRILPLPPLRQLFSLNYRTVCFEVQQWKLVEFLELSVICSLRKSTWNSFNCKEIPLIVGTGQCKGWNTLADWKL